jgi:undecaprenyl-diphosphatase
VLCGFSPLLRRMPEWLAIILLGIIEGVTEFLPVSSTGHLLLAQRWLPRQSDLFNTVVQSGTVLAVILVFTGRLKQLVFRWREPEARDYIAKLAVAFAITGVGGLVLKALDFQLPETVAPVALAILIGGIFFVAIEQWLGKRPMASKVTWRIAIAVGLAQLVAAVFPGTSRSGATILAALVLGLSRPAAIEFTFLLGVPTLLSAGALQVFSAIRTGEAASVDWGMLLLATVVGTVVAFISVKWLLRFVQTHTFVGFGWYRIGLGIVMLAWGR